MPAWRGRNRRGSLWGLVGVLGVMVLAVVAVSFAAGDTEAGAYESYHDPNLNDLGYCTTCHSGFAGGRSDTLHDLHTGGSSALGVITSECSLCHTGSGRDNPLTMWSTGDAGDGLGCAGCHGRDYGETHPTDYQGFPTTGLPKASAYGLRDHHDGAGISQCLACHSTAPGGVQAENIAPPYYARADVNVNDSCADLLDNDGDGLYDAADPDCAPNTPPVAADDAYTTDEDTTLNVGAPGVLGNDTDADGDPLTAVLGTTTANGNVTLNGDGSFTYTPSPDFNGSDSFTYVANDGTDNSNTATVSITVNAVNDPPVADPNGPYNGNVGVAVTFDGSGSSDVDGTIVGYAWDFGDGNTGSGVAPSHIYAAQGTFNVTLTVTDDGGASDTAGTIATIAAAPNVPPVAVDDAYTTDEDTVLNVPAPGVLGNDTDADGDPLTAVLGTNPAGGTLTLNADGSFSYTPALNFNGSDSFTYVANDGIDDSNTATVSITVNAVNDPPVADPNGPYSGSAGATIAFDGSGSTDPDGTIVTYDWNFGDGNTGSGVTPSHAYAAGGTFTVTLTVTDDGGLTDSATTTATISDVANTAPVANDDAYTTDEDVTLTVAAPGVLGNDTDADGDPLAAVLGTNVANGTLTLNANGSFTYTPNADFFGSDSFTYRANDGIDNSNLATVTITVNSVNDLPVAADDAYTTTEDTMLSVAAPGVLSNDTDADGDPLTAVLGTGVANGTLTLNANGSFTYMPDAGFNGLDSFTYRANDGAANSNLATVTITVGAVNDLPVAADDAYTTTEDTMLSVAAPGVLGNDTDADGDPLTANLVGGVSNGTLTLNADGSFTYMPALNFNGLDTFTYLANDGAADSNLATVTITVNAVNDPPVADPNGPYTGSVGLVVSFDGSGSSDVDGTIVSYAWDFGDGNTGTGATPTHTYGTAGTYEVSLTVTDNDGATDSATTTATIAANAAPVAVDDSYSTTQDTTLNVAAPGVLGNDMDPDGDPLTASLDTDVSNGTLTLNADGSFTYVPNAGFFGSDSFTYRANDGADDSNLATVSLTVNQAGVVLAVDDSYTTPAGTPLVVAAPGVLANDLGHVDNMWAFKRSGPSFGTASLSTNGGFTYTPNSGFTGTDSFTYDFWDWDPVLGRGKYSNVATVTITVGGAVNQPPVADPNGPYTGTAGVPLLFDGSGSSDPDGTIVSYDWDFGDGNTGTGVGPTHTYAGAGTYTVSLTVTDDDGASDTATTTATIADVPNEPPVADPNGPYAGTAGVAVAFDGSGSSDPDGTIVSYDWDFGDGNTGSGVNPSHTYSMAGTYTVSLTVTDDDGATGSATTTATIADVPNEPPVADPNGPYIGTVGVAVTFNGSASFDPDGFIASYDWSFGDDSTGTGVSPTHTYAAAGIYTVTLTVTDNDGATGSATTTATISAAPNNPPVAADDAYATDEDTMLNVPAPGVLGNDTDADGDPLTAAQVTGPANGTLTLNADGSFSYEPDLNFFGSDSFTYVANDGFADSNIATVTISVNDVNDAPVADPNGPYAGTAGVAVAFDGAGSSDVDGTIVSYMWDFGDGNTGMGVNPSHTYAAAGTYTVTLMVTDDDGATDTASTTATIGEVPNQPPLAVEDAYTTDEDVTLNVPAPGVLTNDTDADGDPLTAMLVTGVSHGTLSFDSDGSFTYMPGANYYGTDSFTYVANDGIADSNTATVMITVNDVNDPPTADPNGPYSGTVGVAVFFDGSGSFDVDGIVVSYEWDFGDGNSGTGKHPSYTYSAAGTYTVTLTVTDDDGATDSAATKATIAAVPNQPPVADPNGPYTGTAGEPVEFYGSDSYDPDGYIASYLWDFGDGNTSEWMNPVHTYATPGTYTVTLTVTDNDGATDTATTSATISPAADIVDLDIRRFRADNNASLDKFKGITLTLDVENNGTVDIPDASFGATATIVGTQSGKTIYSKTIPVWDPLSDGSTDFRHEIKKLNDFSVRPKAGTVTWTVTLNVPGDVDGPGGDQATATTTFRNGD